MSCLAGEQYCVYVYVWVGEEGWGTTGVAILVSTDSLQSAVLMKQAPPHQLMPEYNAFRCITTSGFKISQKVLHYVSAYKVSISLKVVSLNRQVLFWQSEVLLVLKKHIIWHTDSISI